jgi:hypothetical protein
MLSSQLCLTQATLAWAQGPAVMMVSGPGDGGRAGGGIQGPPTHIQRGTDGRPVDVGLVGQQKEIWCWCLPDENETAQAVDLWREGSSSRMHSQDKSGI